MQNRISILKLKVECGPRAPKGCRPLFWRAKERRHVLSCSALNYQLLLMCLCMTAGAVNHVSLDTEQPVYSENRSHDLQQCNIWNAELSTGKIMPSAMKPIHSTYSKVKNFQLNCMFITGFMYWKLLGICRTMNIHNLTGLLNSLFNLLKPTGHVMH